MEKQTSDELSFDLWITMDKLDHYIYLIRQRELNQYNISSKQLLVLRTVKALGSNATVYNIAKETDREVGVISGQTVILEKDGLIKRTRSKPKSRQFTIELTDKGLNLTKIPRESKTVDRIFSTLNKSQRQQTYLALNRMLVKAKKYATGRKGQIL
jgi:DNA-binding MarR family transcriptional regulator